MTTRRLVTVSDTDSYLKWSLATARTLAGDVQVTRLLVENPVLPSPTQIGDAGSEPVEVVTRSALRSRLRAVRPHVVLLGCTGPVVADLTDLPELSGRDRPVLVTGLPGISVPATRRAVVSRARCDLFVVHSHREVAEFSALAAPIAPGLTFGLARLPFLPPPALAREAADDGAGALLFAAQAKVPARREDRERVLLALAAAGGAVVKLRALDGEQQTHREEWPYPVLRDGLVATGRLDPAAIRFVGGSMAAALSSARGFATVSSTAALEAMAAGLPTLVLDDFGVSAELINLVFEGSGCLGSLADLRSGRLRQPDPEWLAANYFHPEDEDDWQPALDGLLRLRAGPGLPRRRRISGGLPRRWRRRLRLWVPAAWWPWLRRVRRAWPTAPVRSRRARLAR